MEIIIEKCTIDDFEEYYNLKIDENNIFWCGFKNAPQKEKLKAWFSDQLKRKDRIIFLAKSTSSPHETVGYLYLDLLGDNFDEVATGHAVHSNFGGKGLGTKIIRLAIEYSEKSLLEVNQIIGWISIENIGSIKNVMRNGYIETTETKEVFLEDFNKNITMRKYIRPITH